MPRITFLLVSLFLLSGCVGGLKEVLDEKKPEDPKVKAEPRSKRGNPKSYVVFGKTYYTLKSSKGFVERGIASWYGPGFHGKTTSNGEIYDMNAMTAAHKELPLPTFVRVTNLENGKQIVVRVNDRGPFKKNRVIDLSKVAAKKLGIFAKGTGLVEVRALDPRHPETASISVPPPRPIKGDIYVQVGAFNDPVNAQRMREKLENTLGQKVRIKREQRNGLTLYRVQAGPKKTVDEIDALAAQITSLGFATYVVID